MRRIDSELTGSHPSDGNVVRGQSQTRTRRLAALTATLGLAIACSGGEPDDSNIARGRGLAPAKLSAASEASAYDAAARAAFEVGPGLVLMLHPRRLPRTMGYEGGDSVPVALVHTLRERNVVQDSCEPAHDAPRDTPHCRGQQTGYVIRASPVLQLSRDSIELYFAAEAFGPAKGPRPVSLRFEKIYQMVPAGAGWRVAREARARAAQTGER